MKFFLLHLSLLIGLILTSTMVASGRVLINEVHINPPGGMDERYQYVEILTVDEGNQPQAESLNGVSVLFLDSNGGNVGNVEESLNLDGLTTGSNGLLLIGLDYNTSLPWTIASETAVANFSAINGTLSSGDIGPKRGLTVLLVSDFTGKPGDDLDGDDDGNLGQDPWSQILDSIGYGDRPFETRLVLDFTPGNLSRNSANLLQNTTRTWYGGALLNTEGLTSLGFEIPFGPFTGTATPGRPNQAPPEENPIRINEVLINPPRSDSNVEFIELISTTGGITATNNLWLLSVDSDRNGAQGGVVLEAWNLSGQTTGTNGLMLLGNNYTRATNPWRDTLSSETILFDPDNKAGGSSLGEEDIGPNGALTILIVSDFTGTPTVGAVLGDDLDTNDDGVIDARPWDTTVGVDGILDSVGFDQRNDQTGEVLWKTYALGDATQSDNTNLTEPDALIRDPNNLASNSGAAWMGGNIGGDSNTGVTFRQGAASYFGAFGSEISPGRPNPSETPSQATILFNEVHLNPPGDDANFEFIELISPTQKSTAIHNLTLLIVDVSGIALGEIKNVIDLRGLSTGPNGLMVLGDSYNDPPGVYPIPRLVHAEDPPGLNLGEIGPNSDLALLLVEDFSGIQTDDLDVDDDGRFDATPWSSVMDGVGFGSEFKDDILVANLNVVGFRPDSISRLPFEFEPFSAAAWYGGKINGEISTTLEYGEKTFGPFVGAATPGQHNHAGPLLADTILINEINVNPPGRDGRFEFIELISTSESRQSTNGLTLLAIENAGSRGGEIARIWDLDGKSTGSNGILLLGDDYNPQTASEFPIRYWDRSLTPNVEPNTPYTEVNGNITAVGDPAELQMDDIGPNDSFAMLLVRNFSGQIGDDLDTDDNGVLEVFPWDVASGVIDSVGFVRHLNSITPPFFDGFPYSAADLSQTTFVPDTASRRVGNFTPNSSDAWYGGDVAGVEPGGLAYDANTFGLQQGFAGTLTPGLPNGTGGNGNATDDSDGDGVSNEDEAIAGTDPLNNQDFFRVVNVLQTVDSATLQWPTVTGKSYTIEYSTNLISWTSISAEPTVGNGQVASFTDSDTDRQGVLGFYRAAVTP